MLIKISGLYPYYTNRKANTIAHTIEYTFGSQPIMKYHLGNMAKQKIKFFDLDDVVARMEQKLNEPEIYLKGLEKFLDGWNKLLDELVEINNTLKEKEDEEERIC